MWCHLLLLMPLIGLALFVVLPLPVAAPLYLVLSGISLLIYRAALHAMHQPVTTGLEGMIGARATAATDLTPRGRIRYHGELWQAIASEPIPAGSPVVITKVEGVRVHVQPFHPRADAALDAVRGPEDLRIWTESASTAEARHTPVAHDDRRHTTHFGR